jgi:hypothetical protein
MASLKKNSLYGMLLEASNHQLISLTIKNHSVYLLLVPLVYSVL